MEFQEPLFRGNHDIAACLFLGRQIERFVCGEESKHFRRQRCEDGPVQIPRAKLAGNFTRVAGRLVAVDRDRHKEALDTGFVRNELLVILGHHSHHGIGPRDALLFRCRAAMPQPAGAQRGQRGIGRERGMNSGDDRIGLKHVTALVCRSSRTKRRFVSGRPTT